MVGAAIAERQGYSKGTIDKIRRSLADKLPKDLPFSVVASGSYARKEASEQSDIDFFIVCNSPKGKEDARGLRSAIAEAVYGVVNKRPAKGGAFDQEPESVEEMEKNIGGQNDTNDKLTRRILFLLEGDWLYQERCFLDIRSRIVTRYIQSGITDHQLSRFLLNDLIRYYRTVCVDFEYKTHEAGKDWGTRNLKLIFPRKLMYFSGILVSAESAQCSYEVKLDVTNALLAITPIERVQRICGGRATKALDLYGRFLSQFADPGVRQEVAKVGKDRHTHTSLFKDLKNCGHHFSWELSKLLHETYYPGHPIHTALIF